MPEQIPHRMQRGQSCRPGAQAARPLFAPTCAVKVDARTVERPHTLKRSRSAGGPPALPGDDPTRGYWRCRRWRDQTSAIARAPMSRRPPGLDGDGITGMPGGVRVGSGVLVIVPVAVAVPKGGAVPVAVAVKVTAGVDVGVGGAG